MASQSTPDFENSLERARDLIDGHLQTAVSLQSILETLTKEGQALWEENRHLKDQLDSAQTHIFNLQPYLRDLTPDEVGRDYDDLVGSVQDLVAQLMKPWLDDQEIGVRKILKMADRRPGDVKSFQAAIGKQTDLVNASGYVETDEDILVALILRHLWDNVIESNLYGCILNYTKTIRLIEDSLTTAVEPNRDLFSVRSWKAEAYNALVSAPGFEDMRRKRGRELSQELADILAIFREPESHARLVKEVKQRCVLPSMKLNEKLLTSVHQCWKETEIYCVETRPGHISTVREFFTSLDTMDTEDLLQNRKTLNLSKMGANLSREEVEERLFYVCTIVPGLFMRRIGQKNKTGDAVVLRKQRTLVGWGTNEQRQDFCEGKVGSYACHLLNWSERRPERWQLWAFHK